MQRAELKQLLSRQRTFFQSGKTRGIDFRLAQLKKLREAIASLEGEITAALRRDLGKSDFEAYTSEVGIVYEEINLVAANLPTWSRPQHVSTPLAYQPSFSTVYPQPRGVVLIIAPWNYPFQLLFAPLIGAIAAGNCIVLKPSELAPATTAVMVKLIDRTFSQEYCALIEGGISETTALLEEHFDHIFFTGSIPVGKIVMRAAAEHLTSVTLELGGKSPCIVDADTNLKVTARRIVWGKFFNCGQTCVAPDYLLVPRQIKRALLALMKQSVQEFFGANPQESPDYGHIINERHFDRLLALISGEVVLGGGHDRSKLYIAPTVIDQVKMDDKVMEDEIFGPILPVLEYETLDDAFAVVRQRPDPLACYVFSNRRETEERVINELSFGGGCVNNALIHVGNPHLPFGGIGASGMGNYHGQHSFLTFSHQKSITKTPFMLDLPLKYPPYKNKVKLARKIIG